MNAKRQAAKQFAKEQELEKLREKTTNVNAKLDAMTESERAAFSKRSRRRKMIGVLIVAVAFAVVMIAANHADSAKNAKAAASVLTFESKPPTATRTADAGAALTCKDFRKLIVDETAGTLSSTQLHARLSKIYDDAISSADSGINDGALAIYSLAPGGSAAAAAAALNKLSAACTALGH